MLAPCKHIIFAVLLISASTAGLGQAPSGTGAQTVAATRSPLAGVKSWGYQLQHGDPDAIAASPYDLVVVDYSRTGQIAGRFNPTDIRKMQRKPDGRRRTVLAYLSIGEAESYRFYWDPGWVEPALIVFDADSGLKMDARAHGQKPGFASSHVTNTLHFPKLSAPSWLGRENEFWPGNYQVRFWEKGWQDIIFGLGSSSYLEQIIAAGFDGVYLDRVDAYYSVVDDRPQSKDEMVRFVTALSKHAKALKPNFAIVPQNGEDLLVDNAYLDAIDGVAKEDLYYGYPIEGEPNASWIVENSVNWLNYARRRDLPVLVVEYTLDRQIVESLAERITGQGFVPYFGVRSLDRLVAPVDARPTAPKAP